MLHGKIVVIKRTGADGAQFPLTADTCVFGRYGLLIIKIIYKGIKIFLEVVFLQYYCIFISRNTGLTFYVLNPKGVYI